MWWLGNSRGGGEVGGLAVEESAGRGDGSSSFSSGHDAQILSAKATPVFVFKAAFFSC